MSTEKIIHFDHAPKFAEILQGRIEALANSLRSECAKADGALGGCETPQPEIIEGATLVIEDARKLSEVAIAASITSARHPDMLDLAARCEIYADRVQDTLDQAEAPDPLAVTDAVMREIAPSEPEA